jgi:hypothetical protein
MWGDAQRGPEEPLLHRLENLCEGKDLDRANAGAKAPPWGNAQRGLENLCEGKNLDRANAGAKAPPWGDAKRALKGRSSTARSLCESKNLDRANAGLKPRPGVTLNAALKGRSSTAKRICAKARVCGGANGDVRGPLPGPEISPKQESGIALTPGLKPRSGVTLNAALKGRSSTARRICAKARICGGGNGTLNGRSSPAGSN